MTTDLLSTATVTGLLVAGLGAVYAYTQHAHAHARADTTPQGTSEAMRKGKKKRKGKAEGEGEGAPVAVPFPRGVPGDFGGVGTEADVDAGANVGSQAAFLGVVSSKQGNDTKPKPKPKPKTKTKKKQQKKQGKGKDGDEEVGEEEMGKSEVGVDDSDMGRARARGPRSGESTDASASLSPSVSAPALTSSSRAAGKGKGNLRASTRLAPPSQVQPREIRSSLSLDTDSSWTHVDRRGLKTASGSIDGQSRGPTDATSSDVASTASESPVVERTDGVPTDMRGARADLVQRTLAEKLVPRPRKTGVDDMLEQPDVPTLARVMRVQPRADETPVPGFSWDDYGDVVEESVLIDDADQEDEGEWGIIKSRHRIRSTTTTTSHAPAAPETMTKRQRQNARKRELAKSARAEAEAMRLEGLAKHKRELERLRIIEQSQQGGGKRPSGGMQATVDDRGKLVWE